jgi:hypothetical protein
LTSMENEWLSLLRGDLSPAETGPLLSRTTGDLNAFLDAQPIAEQQVLSILAKRLQGQVDGKTWEVLDASLASYLGRERAYLVTWAIEPGQSDRREELEKHGAPRVMGLLRMILSLYGPELENAFEMSNRPPDEWRRISRDVYYDQIAERHLVKILIEKYNGQRLAIEGTASSLLMLTSYMIRSVRLVGTREAFSEQSIELFLQEAGQLQTLLQPSPKAVSTPP